MSFFSFLTILSTRSVLPSFLLSKMSFFNEESDKYLLLICEKLIKINTTLESELIPTSYRYSSIKNATQAFIELSIKIQKSL